MNTLIPLSPPLTPKTSKSVPDPESPLARFGRASVGPKLPSLLLWKEVCKERSLSSDMSTSHKSSPDSSTDSILFGEALRDRLNIYSTPDDTKNKSVSYGGRRTKAVKVARLKSKVTLRGHGGSKRMNGSASL